MTKPKFGPKCPNHSEPLEGMGFPMPSEGTGICPVSGVSFEYKIDIDDDEIVMTKDGKVEKKTRWNVTGDES